MRTVLTLVLQFVTFAFNSLVALFILGIGLMGWASGEPVRFGIIPGVKGESLVPTLIGSGLFGVLSVLLAFSAMKIGRIPMLVWSLAIVSILLCALTRPSYRFEGYDAFQNMAALALLGLIAVWGSWRHLRKRPASSRA